MEFDDKQLLPPCRICERKASGLHYGVNTCEACKRFFKRCISSPFPKEICTRRGSCKFGINQKQACTSCRYQRCLLLGMSQQACKKGRYSLLKKTKDKHEFDNYRCDNNNDLIKPPEEQNKNEKTANNESKIIDTSYEQTIPISKIHNSCAFQVMPTREYVNVGTEAENLNLKSRYSSYVNPSSLKELPNMHDYRHFFINNKRNSVISSEIGFLLRTKGSPHCELKLAKEMSKIHKSDDPRIKMQETITRLCFCLPYPEKTDGLNVLLENERQTQKLKREIFGELKSLSDEEYNDFYSETGIDLDNRQEWISNFVIRLENGIKRLIKFAKTIPGFTDLSISDQIALIKGGRFEAWALTSVNLYDDDYTMVVDSQDNVMSLQRINEMHGDDYVAARKKVIRLMKQMDLTREENAVLKAICLTFPDREDIQNTSQVEDIISHLVTCLRFLLNKNHRNPNRVFYSIWSRIIDIRSLAYVNKQHYQNLPLEWEAFQKSPLVLEILLS